MSETLQPGVSALDGKIIYEWVVPDDYVRTKGEDIATAYRVCACPEAMSGIIAYGLWRGKWEASAYGMRPLIKTLINQLDQLKERTEKK